MDCNDHDATVYPGATEICGDSIDQDCSGADSASADCDADRDGKSSNQGDCNDADPGVFPGAFERCNGKDDNCNGAIDEDVKSTWYKDADKDTYGDPASSTQACSAPSG